MNKIWINTSFELNNKAGIGAYILTLLKIIEKEGLNYKCIELKLPKWVKFKYVFQFVWLNTIIFFKTLIQRPDIFISPSFIMPYFKIQGIKYITVIHDLCHLRTAEMSQYNRFIFNLSTHIAIKKADIIITVSETIKGELIQRYNVPTDKIKVVNNTIAEHFINAEDNHEVLKKYNIEKRKYILSVATLNKRKNIPELIKAFESISDKHPDLKLVLVGGMGNENRNKLTQHPNIIFTGYIKDEEMPNIYRNALLYMYPSLYEGFGIPQIEAQYYNCPILCSDIPVFREVSGEGAEFCEPEAKEIAKKIEYLINNPERREELKKLGCKNVKRFSIEKISEQFKSILTA